MAAVFDELKKVNIYSDEMPGLIIDYLRDDCLEESQVNQYWISAVGYIESYTALDRERLKKLPELVQAVLVLCVEMHDNRSFSAYEKNYINKMIDSLINLHRGAMLG